MSTHRVYSYLRFSSARQAEGHSAERQTDYAQRWAAERGMVLDDALSMRDEGLSAYHQRHIKTGALGVFLRAIDDGRVPPGSVLVVEGLDRLSRAEPIQAQAQMAQIINGGVTVVTASDGKEYNRERLKANPMDLVYSLLVMIRAHEESETKSVRVKAALRKKCQDWQAGTWRGFINGGRDPNWLRRVNGKWETIPERAEVVRTALLLYSQGWSGVRIFRHLESIGLSGTLIGVNTNALYRIAKREDTIGVRIVSVAGESFRLEDYYPPILSREEWQAAHDASTTRVARAAKSSIVSMITGLGICYCGYCGQSLTGMTNHTASANDPATGQRRDSNRRLRCNGHQTPQGCIAGSCSVAPIERAILTYCADQMRLDSLLAGDDHTRDLRAKLATRRADRSEIERKLERLTDALLSAEGAAPITFARQARTLEDEQAGIERDIRSIEGELMREANVRDTPNIATLWATLTAKAMALDPEARTQARKLIADTFARIVVWHSGNPVGRTHIDLQLISRSGAARILTIDRKTGEWREAMDYDIPG